MSEEMQQNLVGCVTQSWEKNKLETNILDDNKTEVDKNYNPVRKAFLQSMLNFNLKVPLKSGSDYKDYIIYYDY
jgi:hypothetical protein